MPSDRDELSELIAGQVRDLVKLVDETDITELRIERGDLKLYIAKGQGKDPPLVQIEGGNESAAGKAQEKEAFIAAPMVGRFYRAAPGKSPLVDCGDLIAKGQKVCVVESMKILNEVESEFDGQIDEILCEDGQAVEYGQPLFRLRPSPPATPAST